MSDDLVAFLCARLDEDERELEKDPPVGLGYANLSARMLREVAAKREFLAEHALAHNQRGDTLCFTCTEGPWPCRTVLLLAAIYSDRPGYRPEWKP